MSVDNRAKGLCSYEFIVGPSVTFSKDLLLFYKIIFEAADNKRSEIKHPSH